ncbi:mast cell-expressed membrane protein 1 isoform X2 [Sminthopsis crassicaudata]|uniref:mast cell-expressed membrane protein 1 isoform X2 n=1 Tax=Sminthopsis crassicaudata TaxID=9301 RepID=UPI003D683E36
MEGTEDIYINQELSPKKRAKKKDPPAGAHRFTEDDGPDYENISVTTKTNNGALKQQSVPIQWAPAASAPSNSSRHSSVHKSLLGIYLLLGLAFLLCIVSLSLLVVKNSEFSMHLRNTKNELWNDLSNSNSKLNYLKNQLEKLEEAQRSGPSPKRNSTG